MCHTECSVPSLPPSVDAIVSDGADDAVAVHLPCLTNRAMRWHLKEPKEIHELCQFRLHGESRKPLEHL